MAELVAIGYPDEATAALAAAEAERLAHELILQPDAIAVVVRDLGGSYRVTTGHHRVAGGATWGLVWGLLFGRLFFVPVLGMAVGAGLGALLAELVIDDAFQQQARELVQPGTSALFLILERATPEQAVAALARYGGTVLRTTLAEDAEVGLQTALHGEPAPVQLAR
jgi:uncharacterized membrane protein